MVYSYQLTLDDYKAAQRLHVRSQPRARFWYIFWIWIMPVVGTISLLLFIWNLVFVHLRYGADLSSLLGVLIWLGFCCVALRPFQVRRGFRTFQEGLAGAERPIELELKNGELISRIPGRSEGRFQPRAILDFVENDRIALLYIRKKLFLFVPKGAVPEEGWAELRAWSGKARTC